MILYHKIKSVIIWTHKQIINIEDLINTNIGYITFDSRNIIGQTKYAFNGNIGIFKQMKNLKHLKLYYKKARVAYSFTNKKSVKHQLFDIKVLHIYNKNKI